MKLNRSWTAALAMILLAQSSIFAQSNDTQSSDLATALGKKSVRVADENVSPAGFQSLGTGGAMAGGLPMISDRCGQFFAGGEYLYVRALPSEAIAYQQTEATALQVIDTLVQFDFQREANYRFYGGYRLKNCGEEIRFTYSSIDSGATSDTGVVTAGSNITFFSPVEVPADQPGSSLRASADVSLKSYDLGWSKTIPLGCPMTCCDDACCGDACGETCGDACGCGNSCCDPCGCWCPAWDITYSAGIRAADYGASRVYQGFDTTGGLVRTTQNTVDFDGIGGRFGLLGRRYLGKSGTASLFLKGDVSLLVGDVEVVNRGFDNTGSQFSTQQISCTHVIPVTEIEAGGTVFLTCNTSITGGYMLGAWHDLGFREDYQFAPLPTTYDDANIMAFDGFFVRLESSF